MKKTASILAFLLGIGLLSSFVTMSRDDANNAAGNISRGFAEIEAGDHAAVAADIREMDQRHQDEHIYGIGGVIALIAGFALWPRPTREAVTESSPVAS